MGGKRVIWQGREMVKNIESERDRQTEHMKRNTAERER